MPRNDPYQATRWRGGDDGSGVRRGKLISDLLACTLYPVEVHEYRLQVDSTGMPVTRQPLFNDDGSPVKFRVVEDHGTALKANQWVTCVHYDGDIWTPIAAHCTGSCDGLPAGQGGSVPPPPPPTNTDEPPPPPPPNPECPPGVVVTCLPGYSQCCVSGQWTCCPDGTGTGSGDGGSPQALPPPP